MNPFHNAMLNMLAQDRNYQQTLETLIFEDKNYEEAKELCQLLLQYNKNDRVLHNYYAQTLRFGFKDYENAEKHYLIALQLSNKNDIIILHNYATMLKDELWCYDETIQYCKKMIELKPADPLYLWKYATILFKTYQFDLSNTDKLKESKMYYEKALAIDRNNVSYYYSYGLLLLSMKKIKQAIKIFEIILTLDKTDQHQKHSLINTIKDSFSKLQQPLENNNDFINYYNHGLALHNLWQYEEAIVSFKKSITLNNEHQLSYYYCASSFMQLQKYSESIKYFEQTIALNNNNYQHHFEFGTCFELYDKYEESLIEYSKALTIAKQKGNINVIAMVNKRTKIVKYKQNRNNILNKQDNYDEEKTEELAPNKTNIATNNNENINESSKSQHKLKNKKQNKKPNKKQNKKQNKKNGKLQKQTLIGQKQQTNKSKPNITNNNNNNNDGFVQPKTDKIKSNAKIGLSSSNNRKENDNAVSKTDLECKDDNDEYNQKNPKKNNVNYDINDNNDRNKGITDPEMLFIRDWLSSMFKNKSDGANYFNLLLDAGYEDINTIIKMSNDDLKEIGVDKPGHRKKLLNSFKEYEEK